MRLAGKRTREWTMFLAALALSACGRDTLFKAANRGDLARVRMLIEQGAEVDGKDAVGETPLFFAVRKGNLDIIRFLLEKGANPNAPAVFGITPFILAVNTRQFEAARLLLERGASIDARMHDSITVLFLAAGKGDLEMTKFLVEHGADTEAKSVKGLTAYWMANKENHPEVAKFLWDAMQAAYDKEKLNARDSPATAVRTDKNCPSGLFVLHRRLIEPFTCVAVCPPGTQPTAPGTPYANARLCESLSDAPALLR